MAERGTLATYKLTLGGGRDRQTCPKWVITVPESVPYDFRQADLNWNADLA